MDLRWGSERVKGYTFMSINHGGRWQVDKFEILYLPACFLENWPKTLLFWDCCALSAGILGDNLYIYIYIYMYIYIYI